jgi:CspA family cold shock protein
MPAISLPQLALRLTELIGSRASPSRRHKQRQSGRDQLMRVTGTLKFFNAAKGFGFVTPADGSKDVFLHASALESAGIALLNEGDKISFVLEDDPRGRGKQAAQVELA